MPDYFEFTISLQDVLPRPWRWFHLHGAATFGDLSDAIRDACGWDQSPSYRFQSNGWYEHGPIVAVSPPDDDEPAFEEPVPDARTVALAGYFGPGLQTSCLYCQDFAAGWTHEVQLEAVGQSDDEFRRRLVGGEHAFPPDGCRHRDYYDLQEALRTGHDPARLLDWARDAHGWTGTFDLEAARRAFDR